MPRALDEERPGARAEGAADGVAAALRQAFLQADQESARQVWRRGAADQPRPRWPKLAALMDEGEPDVLAYMAFPAQRRTKPRSTHQPARAAEQGGQAAGGRGRHLPGRAPSIVRLIGAVLLEQNDEWRLRHRYMQVSRPWPSCSRPIPGPSGFHPWPPDRWPPHATTESPPR